MQIMNIKNQIMNCFVNNEIIENANTPLKHRFKTMYKTEFKTLMGIVHLEPRNAKIHIMIATVYNKTGEICPHTHTTTHTSHQPKSFVPPHNTHLHRQHNYNRPRRYHQPPQQLHHSTRHLPHLHINRYHQSFLGQPQLRIIHHHHTHHTYSPLNLSGNNRPEPRRKVGLIPITSHITCRQKLDARHIHHTFMLNQWKSVELLM